jgi:CDP-diacylglycerol--glycerol-3-phosphate 3-phosphatidyltransferase
MSRFLDRGLLKRPLTRWFAEPIARTLHRLGLSPNAVTVIGLALSGLAAYLAATGHLLPAGIVVLVSGLFDFLDGALARLAGRATRFGALLDSVADRVAEAAILLGLLLFYTRRDGLVEVLLVYLAFVGSVLVSYVRARAEGLGLGDGEGLVTRPERVVILAVGLMVGQVPIALGVVAALSLLTAGQRLLRAWRASKGS